MVAAVILTPLTIAFVALQLGDILTTYYALHKVDGLREGNKVVRRVMDRVGTIPALLLFKVPLVAAVLWYPLSEIALGLAIAFYVWVIFNNVTKIVKAR